LAAILSKGVCALRPSIEPAWAIYEETGAGCGHYARKMLLKVTLALALGSLGMLILHRLRESEDEVSLERKVEAQLQALREHLFSR
jgi:hypothetical protein